MTMAVKDNQRPLTKRGILSTTGSMYDPISPFMLQERLITQDLCRLNLVWDEYVPQHHQIAWMNWKQSMLILGRCIKPKDLGSKIFS